VYFVVGKWVTDSVFVKEEHQPESALKSQAALDQWIREALPPGEYVTIKVNPDVVRVGCGDK
jgi:hypothetical protein